MMQQGKIVVGIGVLISLDRLLKSGHYGRKRLLLVEPVGEEMHPDKRQMGRDLHQCCTRTRRMAQGGVTGAAFTPIQVPLHPQSVEMANAHRHRNLTLSNLFEHDTAWALRVLVEHLPHQGHLHDAQLSPGLKRWTCILRACRLAQGDGHDVILLEICYRMKSAPSP